MARFYPKKQTALIFVICVLAVAGSALYINFTSPVPTAQTNAEQITAKPAEQQPIEIDYDWQAAFFDKASTTSFKPTGQAASAQTEKLTEIDRFGRQFFTKFVQLSQAGLADDPDAVANMTEQFIEDTSSALPSPKQYSQSDFPKTNSDAQSSTIYAETIARILRTYMPAKNEAELALEAFDSQDFSLLSRIDPIISNYKTAITKLLATPVPDQLALHHLGLVNGISMSLFSAEGMRRADTDALGGLNAISLEVTALTEINNAIQGMKTYFNKLNIPFS